MAISHTLTIVRNVVGITGNVISFFMFISPLPTFATIYKKKSVEQFKADPYLATIMNCSLWVFYGLPFVHPDTTLVLTTNAIGLGIELAYISIYFFYADRKGRMKVLMWLTIEAAFLTVMGGCTLGLLHTTDKRTKLVGILSIVFCLGMYVAPLTIMHKVIKTKSVKYMPFWLSLGNFGNGLIWTIYAFIPLDYFILIPNGLGTIAGVAQLALYAYYRKSTPVEEEEEEEEQGKKPASETQMSSYNKGVHTSVQV